MAKVKITGHASGTGVVTVTAPNTSTDRTITLPDSTDTLIGTATTDALTTRINGAGGRKNMLFNGDMRISQRGTSLTSAGDGAYLLDRFRTYKLGGGEINVEQATDSPDDYQHSLKVTVGTADSSIAATDYYLINHRIEGYNTSHLNFGSSAAKTVTLSFWVKSSLTGTFSASINNSAENRSYPYSYTISSADTWEYKTVTIVGDTTGTWATDSTTGIKVWWSLGNGSNYLGTANAWSSTTSQYGVTGETQLISTAGATFQITGVQLELGSVATDFEHRSYGEELALCQRYYEKLVQTAISHKSTADSGNDYLNIYWSEKRATPTLTHSGWSVAPTNTGGLSKTGCEIYKATGFYGGASLTFNIDAEL